MFFDDQPGHCDRAAVKVQTARVPWKQSSEFE
jgi:5'-nucleotidase